MFFYIALLVCFFSLCFFTYKKPIYDRGISYIILIIMILIGGFRNNIGYDYEAYTQWYLLGTRDNDFEFGFLKLMQLMRLLDLSPNFLFFVISFFTYLFLYLGIRKYTDKTTLSLTLYFLIPSLFLTSFTLIRQSLAVAISFYAFSFLVDRKFLVYTIYMLLAISIHYSALLPFLVFPFLYKYSKYVKINYIYIVIIISFIIGQVGILSYISDFFIGSHYYFYVSKETIISASLLKLLILNVTGTFVIYFYSNFILESKRKILLYVYMFSLIALNLSSESIHLTRLYTYFRIFEIILMVDIIYLSLLKKSYVLISGICLFYFLQYFNALIVDYEKGPTGYKMIPYKSLLIK